MAAQQDTITYIALFRTEEHASAALRDLEQMGIARSALTVLGGKDSGSDAAANSLTRLGVSDRDLKHLQDGLNHGGVLISL